MASSKTPPRAPPTSVSTTPTASPGSCTPCRHGRCRGPKDMSYGAGLASRPSVIYSDFGKEPGWAPDTQPVRHPRPTYGRVVQDGAPSTHRFLHERCDLCLVGG